MDIERFRAARGLDFYLAARAFGVERSFLL
jgi:hypothetical protein